MADALYTYSHEIERTRIESAASATADLVEMADVTVQLDGTFLGQVHRFDVSIPSEGFRAELSYNGDVVVDGKVFAHTVTWDERLRSWIVGIIASAPADFESRLDAVRLDWPEIQQWLIAQGHQYLVNTRFGAGEPVQVVNAYDVAGVWAGIITHVQTVTFTQLSNLMEYSVHYLDGSAPKTITRVPKIVMFAFNGDFVGLPPWTGLHLFRQILSLTAWRVRASYDAFPANTITCTAFADTWADHLFEDIDALVERPAWDLTRQPAEYRDLGLRFQNAHDEEPQDEIAMLWPRHAYYDAPVRRLDAEFRPINEDLIEAGFLLPQLEAEPGLWKILSHHEPDPSGHPAYSEDVTLVQMAFPPEPSDAAYILPIQQDDEGDWYVVLDRLLNVEPGEGQDLVDNEIYPRSWLRRYDLSTRDLWQARVSVSSEAVREAVVGRIDKGVRFLGRQWMVQSMRRDDRLESANLTLVRP